MAVFISCLLLVWSTWGFLFFLFSGWGLLAWRLCGSFPRSIGDVFISFWCGWSVVLLLLQIWHLGLPVNGLAFLWLVPGGLTGLFLCRRALADIVRAGLRRSPLSLPFLGATLLYLTMRCIGEGLSFDGGMYHFAAMRWTTRYPIVPGLANLNLHLGKNSIYYLYAALLESGIWANRSQHFANGLLIAVLSAQVLVSYCRLLRRPGEAQTPDLFNAFLGAPLFWLSLDLTISDITSDFAVAALFFALAILAFGFLCERNGDCHRGRFLLLAVFLLASVGIAVKLNAGMLSLSSCGVVVFAFWRRHHERGQTAREVRTVALASLAAFMVLGFWMLSSVILSGYPLFPSSFGAVDVDWRLPEEAVQQEMQNIRTWARALGPFDNNWAKWRSWCWLPTWFSGVSKDFSGAVLPLLVSGAALSVWIAGVARKGRRVVPDGWVFLLVPFASIIYWFAQAPLPRFGWMNFWILAAYALTMALARGADKPRSRLAPRFAAAVGLLLCLAIGISVFREGSIRLFARSGFAPTIRPKLVTYTTDYGLLLHVPEKGAKPLCWDGPLPCTPFRQKNLRLRRDNDLSGGFILDPPQYSSEGP